MSILIRGIEMPKNCAECRFCVNGFTDAAPVYECACETYENVSVLVDDHGKPFDFRPDWCPLIEVPTPHGNLIDRDAPHLKDALKGIREVETQIYGRASWGFANKSMSVIYDAPTIIEAEGNKNENNNV